MVLGLLSGHVEIMVLKKPSLNLADKSQEDLHLWFKS